MTPPAAVTDTASDEALGVRFGPDGLVPAIVQDAADGRVLMLGYLDAEALAATRATDEVHFGEYSPPPQVPLRS